METHDKEMLNCHDETKWCKATEKTQHYHKMQNDQNETQNDTNKMLNRHQKYAKWPGTETITHKNDHKTIQDRIRTESWLLRDAKQCKTNTKRQNISANALNYKDTKSDCKETQKSYRELETDYHCYYPSTLGTHISCQGCFNHWNTNSCNKND